MHNEVSPKPKAGVLLLLAAVAFLGIRGFLQFVIAMRKNGSPSYAIGYSAAQAVLAPAIVASLFCIPKKGRTSRRFAISFVTVSAVMLLLDIGQFGQSTA